MVLYYINNKYVQECIYIQYLLCTKCAYLYSKNRENTNSYLSRLRYSDNNY